MTRTQSTQKCGSGHRKIVVFRGLRVQAYTLCWKRRFYVQIVKVHRPAIVWNVKAPMRLWDRQVKTCQDRTKIALQQQSKQHTEQQRNGHYKDMLIKTNRENVIHFGLEGPVVFLRQRRSQSNRHCWPTWLIELVISPTEHVGAPVP